MSVLRVLHPYQHFILPSGCFGDPHCGFNLYSLIINDIEQAFMSLLYICILWTCILYTVHLNIVHHLLGCSFIIEKFSFILYIIDTGRWSM